MIYINAADGELARIKNTPFYTGRYLESVFDIILNFSFLMTICYGSNTSFWFTILAFIGIPFQGILYNDYENKSMGADSTSKIFEYKSPKAFPQESQISVNILFKLYTFFYAI